MKELIEKMAEAYSPGEASQTKWSIPEIVYDCSIILGSMRGWGKSSKALRVLSEELAKEVKVALEEERVAWLWDQLKVGSCVKDKHGISYILSVEPMTGGEEAHVYGFSSNGTRFRLNLSQIERILE